MLPKKEARLIDVIKGIDFEKESLTLLFEVGPAAFAGEEEEEDGVGVGVLVADVEGVGVLEGEDVGEGLGRMDVPQALK
jgi:hypothetical protein